MGKDKRTTVSSTQSQNQAGSQWGNQSGGYSNMQGVDPGSQAFIDWQRQLAQGGAGAALGAGGTITGTPEMQAILQQMGQGGVNYGQMAAGLTSAAQGLLGTPALNRQVTDLMNPYTQAVIDPTRAEFDRLRGMARTETGNAAQAAGAFGGSRHGVAEGVRLGEIDRAQAGQIAQLQSGGYDKALQAALQLQGQTGNALGNIAGGFGNQNALDLQRQQQLFQNYDYLRQLNQQQGQDPVARYQQALGFANAGLGPTGYQSSGTQTGSQSGGYSGTGSSRGSETQTQHGNLWNDLMGAALTFGPMLFGMPPMPGAAGASGGGQLAQIPRMLQGQGGSTPYGQPLVRTAQPLSYR